jgi:ABC-type antimicrobial peptide transport system permease subunit
MPLLYPIKRVFRSWKLFVALLIGVILAATFFASIIVKANLTANQALEQQLSNVLVDMEFSTRLNYSNFLQAKQDILSVNGVEDVEVIARGGASMYSSSDNYTDPLWSQLIYLPNSSRVYDGWENRTVDGIGENETYVLADTNLADELSVNDTLMMALQFPTPKYDNVTTVYLNLTVAGFAQLNNEAYSIATGNSFYIPRYVVEDPRQEYFVKSDLLIVDWQTLENIWSSMGNYTFETRFLISLNRDDLLNPWDTRTSANNVQTIADNINNKILANYEFSGSYFQNNLGNTLTSFQFGFSETIIINLVIVSLPVFFVAWYLGSTVSNVSYNMRRREIGLLSTKGLSSGQIQRMFFAEALVIGLIGGVIGVFCGLLLNQVFTGINLETLFNPQLLSPYTVGATLLFGMVIAFFAVFFAARRASKIPAVESLREYMPTEADHSYRKKLPWIALILGAYKITLFIIGVNIPELLTQAQFSGGNYLVSIIREPYAIFDQVLNYIGPLLFFWGFTKLLIQNSLKFQQLASRVSRIAGDLGALAAKNVRRNPARSAAIAFLIALIIGYGVQVTGQLASEQDYINRQVLYRVGADVTASVVNASQGQIVLNDILGNVTQIRNATIERTVRQYSADTIMRTIDPDSWTDVAYYENDWFSGVSLEDALKEFRANNMTIILERRVAKQLNMSLYDEIGIDFQSGARKLKIIGFFGPEPTEVQTGFGAYYTAVPTWSYVPRDLFNVSTPSSDAFLAESFDTKILLKLNEGANGTEVAEAIRNLGLEIYGVQSFDEELQRTETASTSYSYSTDYTYNNKLILEVQKLGLIFVVLAASVGTALVSIVSIRERSREATLMSVKGLSYRQIVWMFLNENLAVVTFAVVLGVVVGLIVAYGSVTSSNTFISELVRRRIVFPNDSLVAIGSYISLIFASTIVPIMVMSRQFVTKLERMIRLR